MLRLTHRIVTVQSTSPKQDEQLPKLEGPQGLQWHHWGARGAAEEGQAGEWSSRIIPLIYTPHLPPDEHGKAIKPSPNTPPTSVPGLCTCCNCLHPKGRLTPQGALGCGSLDVPGKGVRWGVLPMLCIPEPA